MESVIHVESWTPCASVAGFHFGEKPSDPVLFARQHRLVSSKQEDEFGHDNYESVDAAYSLIMDDSGVASACFDKLFVIRSVNLVGCPTHEVVQLLAKEFSLSDSDFTYDVWVDIDGVGVFRDVSVDSLCCFITENEDEIVTSVSVYG